ncbi:MAG: response regulator [Gemmatimonadetes bacterium]|nr:response regulator [Gemmatimonadota bacterium]
MPVNRRFVSILTPYLGVLAAAAGAALLVGDVVAARAAGAPATHLTADAVLAASGFLSYLLAKRGAREAPALALLILVAGSAPTLLFTGRWWLGGAVGALLAAVAPHAVPSARARIWIGAAVALSLTTLAAGAAIAAAVAGFVLLVGAASNGLAGELQASRARIKRAAITELDQEHQRAAELLNRLQGYEGPAPARRRSYLRLALSRRLGMMTALANSMERELQSALDSTSTSADAIAAAAKRGMEHAARIGELATGSERSSSSTTTLASLWPRVRSYLGSLLLPSHHLETTIAPELPPVVGTAEEWTQIITLVAEDALAAMPGGGILRVDVTRSPRDGFAQIIIADTRTRAAEGEPESNRESLDLAEALLAALGGTLRQSAGGDVGVEVTIETPFFRPEPAAPAPPAITFTGRVLLADDDAGARRTVTGLLEQLGFAISEVDNGTAALARFRADPSDFRAAVLDVVMPGIPVGDVVAAIREIQPDLPVILISGYDVSSYVDGVLALGRVRYLRKPVNRRELAASLQDLLPAEGAAST